MNTQTLALFLTTCFLLSMTPGPNMLSALGMGLRHGLVGAAWGGLGMCTALGLLAGLSALGVGALLEAAPRLFTAFRLAGAAYLVWLGIQAFRAPGQEEAARAGENVGARSSLFVRGVLITLSNPKALIFMAAFFPQFLDPHRPAAPQLGILVTGMLIIEFGWIMVYAAGGKGLASRLTGREARRRLDRMTGALLIAAGLILGWAALH